MALYETHATWVSKPTLTGAYLYYCVHYYQNILGLQGSVISKPPPGLLTVFIIPSTVVLQKNKTRICLNLNADTTDEWKPI
jgi:hypothetical protein